MDQRGVLRVKNVIKVTVNQIVTRVVQLMWPQSRIAKVSPAESKMLLMVFTKG